MSIDKGNVEQPKSQTAAPEQTKGEEAKKNPLNATMIPESLTASLAKPPRFDEKGALVRGPLHKSQPYDKKIGDLTHEVLPGSPLEGFKSPTSDESTVPTPRQFKKQDNLTRASQWTNPAYPDSSEVAKSGQSQPVVNSETVVKIENNNLQVGNSVESLKSIIQTEKLSDTQKAAIQNLLTKAESGAKISQTMIDAARSIEDIPAKPDAKETESKPAGDVKEPDATDRVQKPVSSPQGSPFPALQPQTVPASGDAMVGNVSGTREPGKPAQKLGFFAKLKQKIGF